MKKYFFKYLNLILLFASVINAVVVSAQKLPNTQEGSVRISANIKIDGKPNEFYRQFMAYNKSTELSYTIANDNEKIYLIVQAKKARIIEKIIDVGITFIINKDGKKSDRSQENMEITFPVIDAKNGQYIISDAGAKSDIPGSVPAEKVLDTTYKPIKDSLIKIANKLFASNAKTIKIKGLSETQDTLISIYNEIGVRAAANFDNKGIYTYELSIPLKILGLSEDTHNKFSYSIKLKSRLIDPKKGMVIRYHYEKPKFKGEKREGIDIDQDLDSVTDFWAEYALAKKP